MSVNRQCIFKYSLGFPSRQVFSQNRFHLPQSSSQHLFLKDQLLILLFFVELHFL